MPSSSSNLCNLPSEILPAILSAPTLTRSDTNNAQLACQRLRKICFNDVHRRIVSVATTAKSYQALVKLGELPSKIDRLTIYTRYSDTNVGGQNWSSMALRSDTYSAADEAARYRTLLEVHLSFVNIEYCFPKYSLIANLRPRTLLQTSGIAGCPPTFFLVTENPRDPPAEYKLTVGQLYLDTTISEVDLGKLIAGVVYDPSFNSLRHTAFLAPLKNTSSSDMASMLPFKTQEQLTRETAEHLGAIVAKTIENVLAAVPKDNFDPLAWAQAVNEHISLVADDDRYTAIKRCFD